MTRQEIDLELVLPESLRHTEKETLEINHRLLTPAANDIESEKRPAAPVAGRGEGRLIFSRAENG